MELRSDRAATTRAIGAAIAGLLVRGDVVLLTGDLGTGKTELAKGLIAALGVDEPVVSPTFAIVREYDGTMPVHHVDVYRLDRVQEVIDLGLEEFLDDGATIVEWGEGIRELLPDDRLEITIALVDADDDADGDAGDSADPGSEDTRTVTVSTRGPGWEARRAGLEQALTVAGETRC